MRTRFAAILRPGLALGLCLGLGLCLAPPAFAQSSAAQSSAAQSSAGAPSALTAADSPNVSAGQGADASAPVFTGDARGIFAQAEDLRFSGDWYGAIEGYLAALERNPSYGEALYGLAECYYELEQYDQALSYARRAAPFLRGDSRLADLEGFIDVGLADLAGARASFQAVLALRPNDLDARFGMALLDLAAGKKTEARLRLEDSLRLSPQNARALLSLAVIASDQGRSREAQALIEKALRYHGSEPRTQYVAARLSAEAGDTAGALFHARTALQLKSDYPEARLLLASLLYESGSYDQAIALMRAAVAADRSDGLAWYTLGLAQVGAGKTTEAIYSLKTAASLRPDDEIVRLALEDAVMDGTPLEDIARNPYAEWHFRRGRDFEDRSYFDEALFEYRRGLTIYPYSTTGRLLYAHLLKERGYPGRYLGELKFIRNEGAADRNVQDAIEIYDSLLVDSVGNSWSIDENSLTKRPYKLALFYEVQPGDRIHAADEALLARYVKDIFASSTRLSVVGSPLRAAALSAAFRRAREMGADYFLILKTSETERHIQIDAELRVARTGSPAASFGAYRTGNDRVKNAVSQVVDSIETALPPQGGILKRRQDTVLVDLGKADGIADGAALLVIKQGRLQVRPEGLGLSYPDSAILGQVTLTRVGEEASEGTLKSSGFFDTVNIGDRVVLAPLPGSGNASAGGSAGQAAPALAAARSAPGSSASGLPANALPGLFLFVRSLR
ncbi:MAG TPA: tetratricopeptide repeat protein [Rectinemataceae bacterium]|nr:tetratricopeptide repeat protein [Rectinemataceae bacterium]